MSLYSLDILCGNVFKKCVTFVEVLLLWNVEELHIGYMKRTCMYLAFHFMVRTSKQCEIIDGERS